MFSFEGWSGLETGVGQVHGCCEGVLLLLKGGKDKGRKVGAQKEMPMCERVWTFRSWRGPQKGSST